MSWILAVLALLFEIQALVLHRRLRRVERSVEQIKQRARWVWTPNDPAPPEID